MEKEQQIHQNSENEQEQLQTLRSDEDDDSSYLAEGPLIKEKQVQINVIPEDDIVSGQSLVQKVHKDLQLIYIIAYCTYRKYFQAITEQYGCGLDFIKNSYIIYCQDSSSKKSFEECVSRINKQVSKILYLKLQFQKKYSILYSPYYNKRIFLRQFIEANDKGIYYCLFNNEVLIYSNKFTKAELEEEKKKIINYCNIFTVRFIKKKKSFEVVDYQISMHYKTVLERYYKERFQANNLVVEVNLLNTTIYIIGKPGCKMFKMMQAKSTVKSMIQGLTGLGFKNNNLSPKEQKTLIKYLEKKFAYPITFSRINQHIVLLLSKDNNLREFLKRKEQLKTRVGIVENTQIGLYFPPCFSVEQKRSQIYKICREYSFDNWSQWGIRYFRQMISNQGEKKDQDQVIELVSKIILGFIEVKEKFEIMKLKNEADNKMDRLKKKLLEEQDKYAYELKNCNVDSKQLEKLLRRDVLEDQVYMKKKYNVIYSVLEGKEYGPFYVSRKEYDKGIVKGNIKFFTQEQLQKGQYLKIYLKLSDEIKQSSKQSLQKLFIQELKSLKQAAQNQKKSHVDQNRKVAHMIKKLIIVM